jgi:acyl dehydratase
MPGLYFEDFEIGQMFVSAARTVTESDVVAFAGLSGDFNSIHTNAEFARTTPYGQRIAHAALGIAFVTGLTARLGIFDGTAVEFVGMDWRFVTPILIGDTVHCEITIAAKEDGTLPDRGALIREIRLLKHDGTVAQQGTSTMMVLRRLGT